MPHKDALFDAANKSTTCTCRPINDYELDFDSKCPVHGWETEEQKKEVIANVLKVDPREIHHHVKNEKCLACELEKLNELKNAEIQYVPLPGHRFSDDEIKALYRMISHQWIDREDSKLMELVNRISRINDDISRRDNQAT